MNALALVTANYYYKGEGKGGIIMYIFTQTGSAIPR